MTKKSKNRNLKVDSAQKVRSVDKQKPKEGSENKEHKEDFERLLDDAALVRRGK